jgi:hypothetical protein
MNIGTTKKYYLSITTLLMFASLGGFFFCQIDAARALSATVNIPEKYTEVHAGDRIYFQIDIKYPENPVRKDLRMEYQIKKGDEIIAQSKVLKAVETQSSFMDFIVIPESAKEGIYTINVKISDYGNLNQDVSASFKVIENSNQAQAYFLIIAGLIVLLGIIISLEINKLRKNL